MRARETGGPPRRSLVGLLAVLLVATPVLSGCLTRDGTPAAEEPLPDGQQTSPAVQVPVPGNGSRFHYEASDGTTLNVTVRGFAERHDAWLRERLGRVLEMRHPFPRPDGPMWRFEETVDPESGLVIQHWARCGAVTRSSQDEPWRCWGPRGQAILGAQGWPGGLGAAPFWGQSVLPEAGTLGLDLALAPNLTLPYQTGQVPGPPGAEGPCLIVEPRSVPASLVWVLEFTGGTDAFTLCDGIPLPVRFTGANGLTYQLAAWSPGEEAPTPPSQPSVSSREPVVPLRDRSLPLLAASPEHDTPFPTRQAHRVARERVDAYDRLFDEAPNATLAFSQHSITHEKNASEVGLSGGSRTHERRLKAFADDGRWVSVEVTKRIQEGGRVKEGDVTYEVQKTDQGRDRTPTFQRDRLRLERADLNRTLKLGRELTGQPVDEWMGTGATGFFPRVPWISDGPGWRPAGPPLVAWYEDAHPRKSGGGPIVEAPYRFVVDGPTGSILSVGGPRATLNETVR